MLILNERLNRTLAWNAPFAQQLDFQEPFLWNTHSPVHTTIFVAALFTVKKKRCTHRGMTKWEIRAYLHCGTHYAASGNTVPTQEGICEILSEKSTLLHECKNNNHLFMWDDVSTCTKCLREFPPVKLLERWDWHVSKRGLCFFLHVILNCTFSQWALVAFIIESNLHSVYYELYVY